ncbi:fimbrillin family protein [Bacteroides reticulotermitis]|uniref:Fimbrillin family protein n=1 Tax=Bacteroides reticulotermitis JCM 10512 TaxID=1445607 RepID=W4UTI8_9BACE|nr:fimbrillin family protein [Bacteroides reticulotermitis]GAE84256.1 hypothetical protein JCM10512_2589 [Bacteroides reticulotermitis JCM 10512]
MKSNLVFRSLLLLAAGCAFHSCSEELVESNVPATGRNEISFRVNGSKMTKAATTTLATLNNFTLTALTGSTPDIVMDAVSVVRSQDGSLWEYSPKTLWPATQVNFFAYSPANTPNVTAGFKTKTDHTLTYTVPTEAQKQEDFLVAVQEKTAAAGNTTVTLNFKHALSRVLVNARTATQLKDIPVTVTKVTFKNLATTGTLQLAKDVPASTGTPAKTVSKGWPMDDTPLLYAAGFTNTEIADGSFDPAYVTLWTGVTGKESYEFNLVIGTGAGTSRWKPLTLTSICRVSIRESVQKLLLEK